MTRVQKSIEEQLAEATNRRAKLNARVQALNVKKKQHENRLRGQGEKTLLRLMLEHIQAEPAFRVQVEQLVVQTRLRPDEQRAVGWVMNTLKAANAADEAAAPDAGQQAT